ncbi:MAG: ADP-ribosylglycohydrolase family protein, partial [Vibrio gallaecicus]
IGAVLAACFYEEDGAIPTEWLNQVELNGGVLSLPIE